MLGRQNLLLNSEIITKHFIQLIDKLSHLIHFYALYIFLKLCMNFITNDAGVRVCFAPRGFAPERFLGVSLPDVSLPEISVSGQKITMQ